MKSVLNTIKSQLNNDSAAQEQFAQWQSTTNIYIAKLMAMGGYTRKDILANIVAMFDENQIIWNEALAEHHAKLHQFLEAVIAEEARQIVAKLPGNPFVIVAIDPAIVTMTDMAREANILTSRVPESVISVLRALS